MAEPTPPETPELRRLRRRIDALDRRLVALLNERAELAREAGRAKRAAGRRAIRDAEREREVLLRVTMANAGPLAPGRPPGALPAADGRDARARGARSRSRTGETRAGWRSATTSADSLGAPARSAGPASRPAPTGLPAPRPRRERRSGSGAWRRRAGGSVLLRIEDHDRAALPAGVRRRAARGPGMARASSRTRARPPVATTTRRTLPRSNGCGGEVLVYGCDCSRSTFEALGRTSTAGRWHGPGCPGDCRRPRSRRTGPPRRARRRLGTLDGRASSGRAPTRSRRTGDLPIRDRDGNWTYAFAVVVDDLRQGVDLVVRGRDLLAATPAQIRLARLLGREAPATFAHHPLIRRPDGAKLSKADGDTGGPRAARGRPDGRRADRRGGRRGRADRHARPIEAAEVGGLFDGSST